MVETLSRTPRALPIVLFVVLVVGGVLLRGVLGGLLLVVAAAFVGWLAYLVWPRLSLPERVMRCAVLLLVTALAVVCFAADGLLI